jgi:hypothetical protein
MSEYSSSCIDMRADEVLISAMSGRLRAHCQAAFTIHLALITIFRHGTDCNAGRSGWCSVTKLAVSA